MAALGAVARRETRHGGSVGGGGQRLAEPHGSGRESWCGGRGDG